MRSRDFRCHAVHLFEHPYRIAAGPNQWALIGRGGEILFRFLLLLFDLGRRVAQIPSCALKTSVRSALNPPDRLTAVVVYQKVNFRFRFLRFCPQFVIGRVGKHLVLFRRVFFGVLAFFLLRLEFLLQVRGKNGAVRRIVGAIECISLKTLPRSAQRAPLDIHERISYGIHGCSLVYALRFHLAQRGDVIQHIESAPEGRDHEIVFARLDDDVTHRNRW